MRPQKNRSIEDNRNVNVIAGSMKMNYFDAYWILNGEEWKKERQAMRISMECLTTNRREAQTKAERMK